jgi:rfaE bifunctional protein nucleotidyltransferase chain/domain
LGTGLFPVLPSIRYFLLSTHQYSITPSLRSLCAPPPHLPRRKRCGQNGPVNFRKKIVAWNDLPRWRAAMRASGKRLVVTNGCFDLLHVGHVTYLETARNHGDALLVGLNGDESVRQLKGPDRPLNPEDERAAVLAALESVAGVCIFAEMTATRFLAAALPDIYVKGGDYTLDTLNQDERQAVEQAGGKIVIIPFVPGKSTTAMLRKISRL